MKLEFLYKINEFDEHAVRLSDFNSAQARAFRDAVQHAIIQENKPLEVTGIDFIHHKKASTSRDELVKKGLLQPLQISYKKKVANGAVASVILAACGVTLYKLLHKDNKKQQVPAQA